MLRKWIGPLVVLCVAASAAPVFADGSPCDSLGPIPLIVVYVDFDPVRNSACNTTDLIWSPGGSEDVIVVRVTVMDGHLEEPLANCSLSLELDPAIDPDHVIDGNGFLCGDLTRYGVTDPNGVVAWELNGGGTGMIAFNWTVNLLCCDPLHWVDGSDTLCVKSYDLTGDGKVNFFDTFRFIPMLANGYGWAGDYAQCTPMHTVNFFDTFEFLPPLQTGETCSGVTMPEDGFGDCSLRE